MVKSKKFTGLVMVVILGLVLALGISGTAFASGASYPYKYTISATGTQDVPIYPDQAFTWTVTTEGYHKQYVTEYMNHVFYHEGGPFSDAEKTWYPPSGWSTGGAVKIAAEADPGDTYSVIENTGSHMTVYLQVGPLGGHVSVTYRISRYVEVHDSFTDVQNGSGVVNATEGDKYIAGFDKLEDYMTVVTSRTCTFDNPNVNVSMVIGSTGEVYASTEYEEIHTIPWSASEPQTPAIDLAPSQGAVHITDSVLMAPNGDTVWTVQDNNTYVNTWMAGNQLWAQAVKVNSTTSLVSSLNSAPYGEAITFTATVKEAKTGPGFPDGTVQFRIDGNDFGSPVPLTYYSTGCVAVSAPASGLTIGDHTVTAVYSGDVDFHPSEASITQTITKAQAQITLDNLYQVYDGTGKSAAVTTIPDGLNVIVTYNGNSGYPVNAGSYAVEAVVDDPNYEGSAADTLTIAQANVTATITGLQWIYDGQTKEAAVTLSNGQVPFSVTYNNSSVLPLNAGQYTVKVIINDPNYRLQESNTGNTVTVLVIEKATAQVTLSALEQTYDGNEKAVTVTTIPEGLNVSVTYDGGAAAPVNTGSYAVLAAVDDPNYEGSASGTLVISKIPATVILSNLEYVYDTTAKSATIITDPAGVAVSITYNGSDILPVNAGSYAVEATVTDISYEGSAEGILIISKAPALLTLSSLEYTYDGTPKSATVTVTPEVAYTVTYNGLPDFPLNAGSYAVEATIDDPNYEGSVTGTLVIAKAAAAITLNDLDYTYDGAAKSATVTVTPEVAYTVTYNGLAEIPVNAGSYAVLAMVTDPNYEGSASGTLTIQKTKADIKLSNLVWTYDGTPKSAMVITDPPDIDVAVTYNDKTALPVNAGIYLVSAKVTDPGYSGAAWGVLVISRASQSITFDPIADKVYGDPDFTVNPVASSGLKVRLVAFGPCVINGNTVHITGTGTCTIIAYQFGDNNYKPAPTVSRTFKVTITYDRLRELVKEYVDKQGVENSLIKKLDNAEKAENKHNRFDKANQINAFINEVQAQSGKALTRNEAQILIMLARAL